MDRFFYLLYELDEKFKFTENPHRIWNTDETGIPTVLKPPKVIALKGMKQVNQTVSHERGVNTTMLGFVSAAGNSIPPVFIFPRKNFLASMIAGGPTGCKNLAHPSGWINGKTFLEGLKHFVAFTKCGLDNPHLLLLDNHCSHLDFAVINYANANGIVMLTFPPHCSHRLQPLDVSVFSSFKSALKNEFNSWLQKNPGRRISIHEIAQLSKVPYDKAFSRENVMSGFLKAGIFPKNREVFPPSAFFMAKPTDRPG